jgi:hypothetical protein
LLAQRDRLPEIRSLMEIFLDNMEKVLGSRS